MDSARAGAHHSARGAAGNLTQFTRDAVTKPHRPAAVLQFTAWNGRRVQDAAIMRILAGAFAFFQSCFGSRASKAASRKPDTQLRKRAEALENGGSTGSKLALADECSAHRMNGEAIRLYESCLQGACAGDSTILFRLARAAVDAGLWDKAEAAIERLKSEAPKTRPLEVRLLEARVLEGRQRTDEAIALYHRLLPRFVGLEAKYRYGELLAKLGEREAAIEVFNDVLKAAGRYASPIEEEERWATAAKQAVKAA